MVDSNLVDNTLDNSNSSMKITDPQLLPKEPGVYIMKNSNDEVIYVGKSKSLRNRVKSYFKDKHESPKTHVLMNHFDNLDYILTDSEKNALILEAKLIKKYNPRYNIRLKDDKQYPYIKITDEKYPRILITRKIGKTGKHYGPFTDVSSVRQMVKFVKSLFKIRTCKRMDGPCLNSQIELCNAPCTNNISLKDYKKIISNIDMFFQGKYEDVLDLIEKDMYNASKNEEFEKAAILRDQINSIKELMNNQFIDSEAHLSKDIIACEYGEKDSIIVILSIRDGKIIGKEDYIMAGTEYTDNLEVTSAFIKQFYINSKNIPQNIMIEERIKDLDIIEEWLTEINKKKVEIVVPEDGPDFRLIRLAKKNAKIIKNQKNKSYNILLELKKYLKLKTMPNIIESYDISNISGKMAVGSKVSFYGGKPEKSKYRIFNLETPGPDDYAMMKETLERRFKSMLKNESDNEDLIKERPDLLVIDGGKGQLNIAVDVLNSLNLNIPVIGLAKEFETVFIPNVSEPIILPRNSESLFLLQRIRDEAHRFAVKQHRTLRSKELKRSELDEIEGIGPKRKQELLKHFKSINEIKTSSIEELLEVKGMNKTVAKNVYNFYNK